MKAGAFRALRHKNFRLYAAGQAVSLSGSWLHNTALSWLLYRMTHSEWLAGLLSLSSHLPMLVLGLAGGAAADAFPRRALVLATQTVFLTQAALLAWLTGTGRIEVWMIFALGALNGVANAFDIPARQAMLLDMTGQEELISAIGLNSMIFNLARIAGPSLAGLALAEWGEAWCFGLNAASFLAVLAGLLLMRFEARKQSAAAATWAETWRHLREQPGALALLGLCAGLNVGFSGVFVLNPFFAADVFGLGPRGLGVLTASMGLGAVMGTYLLAKETNQKTLPRVSMLSGMAMGAAFLGYAASGAFVLSLLLMAVAGGSLMRQNGATNSVLQAVAPGHLRGRIVSLFGMAVVGMGPLGAALAGAVARGTGPRTAAALSGVWCLGLSAWVGWRLRRMALLVICLAPLGAADEGLKGQVKELLAETSRLTGLKVKRQVPAGYLTKAELERYLAKKMKEEVKPEALAIEEIVIKRLGFAKEDFRLKETTLELLNEQAAAFYDFKERKLFVIQPVMPEMTAELLVHELGHALQDQHFGLRKFLNGAGEDDDGALARMAVMEGQAMYLMAKAADRPIDLGADGGADGGAADAGYPVLAKAPLYLRASLLFPYEQGARFQAAVCEKYADCIKRVFETPPASTAQVMHPELYFAGVKPVAVPMPESPRTGAWKTRATGNLGEFDFQVLLRTHGVPWRGLTEKWRGGGYRLLENKKAKNVFLLQHASEWADEEAAGRWMDAYRQVLRAKESEFRVEREDAGRLEGRGEHGRVLVRREGKRVVVEEGLPENVK